MPYTYKVIKVEPAKSTSKNQLGENYDFPDRT
jgi:hypothetical protein